MTLMGMCVCVSGCVDRASACGNSINCSVSKHSQRIKNRAAKTLGRTNRRPLARFVSRLPTVCNTDRHGLR